MIKNNGGIFGRNPTFNNVEVEGNLTVEGLIIGPVVVDANTLTGTTLANNVLNSSLTSVGTLTSLTTSSNITFSEPNGPSLFGLGNGFDLTNVALGNALQNCTPDASTGNGQYNLGIGSGSLNAITIGVSNTAVGANSLAYGQTCSQNIAIGDTAMGGNPSAPQTGIGYNIAIGNASCSNLTTNTNVIGIGRDSFTYLNAGNSSIAIGLNAGKFAISNTFLTSTTNSIYIGQNSKASAATGNTNEIVIGSAALGLGSNTSVFGNSSTTASTVYGVLTPSKGLLAPAGTITIAPIKLQSGTNLTTPTSGVIEFDGKAMYGTVASGRGLIPTEQFSIITTTKSLNSSAVPQNVFDTPEDTITLALDTTYSFEGFFSIVSGTTSHTTSINLVDSAFGTESISWRWMAMGHSAAAGTNIKAQDTVAFTTNGGVITASSTVALTTIWFRGVVIVTSGGPTPVARSVIPKITFSAAPTGTNQVAVGSFIRFVPIGSNLVKSVGHWS